MQEAKDDIILLYNSVYRGIIEYYRFAENFNGLSAKVHYILKESCARLLVAKYKAGTQTKIWATYGKNLKGQDKHEFVKIVRGINTAALNTKVDDIHLRFNAIGRQGGLTCVICDSNYRVEMQHVRMMKDLNPKASNKPRLGEVMASVRRENRKQIPLCIQCHMKHHSYKQ